MAILADSIWSRWLVWVFIAAWGISLFLPVALFTDRPTSTWPGYMVLALGYLGVMMFQFGWFANIGFFSCIVKLLIGDDFPTSFLRVPLITLVLAVNALFWHNIPSDAGDNRIDYFGAGYFVWLFAVVGAAMLVLLRSLRDRPMGNNE